MCEGVYVCKVCNQERGGLVSQPDCGREEEWKGGQILILCFLQMKHEGEADNYLYAYEAKHRTRKSTHPMREGMSDLGE